jgi:hypothetical protein
MWGTRLGLQGEDEAVFADGEADAGGAWAAEHLGEAVVAAAAEEGVLCAEAAGWIAGRGTPQASSATQT